ncbi:MAG: hypothetical protein CENE_03334 [Candidatus Celerinatantimonas neptuna]|nr:MAG: hypothetical protein CENE_03334 [Candidatus Celerinatantimonas neptuna]
MKQYFFNIHIYYDDFLRVYQGNAKNVVIKCDEGLIIQLPAHHFLPYVTQIGIRGRFILTTDNFNKFISLEKIV